MRRMHRHILAATALVALTSPAALAQATAPAGGQGNLCNAIETMLDTAGKNAAVKAANERMLGQSGSLRQMACLDGLLGMNLNAFGGLDINALLSSMKNQACQAVAAKFSEVTAPITSAAGIGGGANPLSKYGLDGVTMPGVSTTPGGNGVTGNLGGTTVGVPLPSTVPAPTLPSVPSVPSVGVGTVGGAIKGSF